jgi:hypothetical protein
MNAEIEKSKSEKLITKLRDEIQHQKEQIQGLMKEYKHQKILYDDEIVELMSDLDECRNSNR